MLETHTFATSLCCRQKALLEPHSASGQLCAEQATGPFSVCVLNSPSFHTYIWSLFTLCRCLSFELSPSFSLALCPHFVVIFCCASLKPWLSFVPLFSGLRHYAKLPEKGLLAMPVCASMLPSIHFRSFPFFPVTRCHNCCCSRRTKLIPPSFMEEEKLADFPVASVFVSVPFLILYIPSSLT